MPEATIPAKLLTQIRLEIMGSFPVARAQQFQQFTRAHREESDEPVHPRHLISLQWPLEEARGP